MRIIRSYEAGCHNTYEMAEYLDVTEEFLKESLDCYRKKYGEYVEIDSYIIYFEPHLGVFKLILKTVPVISRNGYDNRIIR